MKEVAFVINPVSVAHVERVRGRCRAEALERGWEPHFFNYGPGPGHDGLTARVAEFARQEVSRDRLIFAVGGDGTVRTCAQALAHSQVPLAVVPRGTANLFARGLGLPAGLDDALTIGFAGQDRQVDLGLADGHVFTTIAGIGIDAAVVAATPRFAKDHLGWVGYAMAAVPQLSRAPHDMEVRLDGREPLTTKAQSVVVGNVGVMPGGFGLFPGASMDDGILDVGVLFPKSVLGWALMARTVLAKGHFADRYFAHYRAEHIEISADTELPRQLDGDLIGSGRSFSLSVQAGALRARVALSSGVE